MAADAKHVSPAVGLPLWAAVLLSLLGGLLMSLAFYPCDCGGLVWVGLLPLLTALWLGKPGFLRGFLLGWLYAVAWHSVNFWWVNNVGSLFGNPLWVFGPAIFLPLMGLYAVLVGLWAGVANTLLRPRLEPVPIAEGGLPQIRRQQMCDDWALRDLGTTLRCALGCGMLWVCVDWARGAAGPAAITWAHLAMPLYHGLSLAQWADVVGLAGLAFLPVFTNVVLWGAGRRCILLYKGARTYRSPWDFYLCMVLVFGLFIGGIFFARAYSPTAMASRESVLHLPVMSMQRDIDQHVIFSGGAGSDVPMMRDTLQHMQQVQQNTIEQALRQKPGGGLQQALPVWVVWPESAMARPLWRDAKTRELLPDRYTTEVLQPSLAQLREEIGELATPPPVFFAGTTLYDLDPDDPTHLPRGHNTLAVFPPNGTPLTASKQHLMPFGEYVPFAESCAWVRDGYRAFTGMDARGMLYPGEGTEPLNVPVPGSDETVQVIPAVCFEDGLPGLLRPFVRRTGRQVIVNCTNDGWFGDSCCGEMQARAAAYTCIALRRPMVRAANKGLCCAIAPNGALLDPLRKDGDCHTRGFSYALLPVDANASLTIFAVLGEWTVIPALLTVILTSLPAFFRRYDTISAFRRPLQQRAGLTKGKK